MSLFLLFAIIAGPIQLLIPSGLIGLKVGLLVAQLVALFIGVSR